MASSTLAISEANPILAAPPSLTDTEPQPRKPKISSHLNRWSMARTIKSGRKLDRPDHRMPTVEVKHPVHPTEKEPPLSSPSVTINREEEGKWIYMVSDGTGWTAEHSVSAALGQFEYCFVDRGCIVNTRLFSGINDVERLIEIIKQAAKEGAMLVYTLADRSMAKSARQACELWGVPFTDILSPITEAISSHLGVSPSGLPRGAPGRSFPLSEEYFQRIEAIEFTIKLDDGALPQNLHKADIILVGVSRTGKTPLSIYLSQNGHKVANVPIVMGVDLPKTLFEVDQEKVFGLTINPSVLHSIRRERAKGLGFGDEERSNYSEMDHVRRELDFANRIFVQNPTWPVIEVTEKAIEETAAIVLRLYQDRKNKCSVPIISSATRIVKLS
ncbi:hypothetical protein LguiA_015102 [Lonicera macranthoides]